MSKRIAKLFKRRRLAALEQQTEAMQALLIEMRKQNERASACSVNSKAVTETLADLVSGNLGVKVQRRIDPPSFGSVSRA